MPRSENKVLQSDFLIGLAWKNSRCGPQIPGGGIRRDKPLGDEMKMHSVAASVAFVLAGLALSTASQAQHSKHTITVRNVDALTAKYELVEFMSRRSYSGGLASYDDLKFRKPMRNPYTSKFRALSRGHNVADEITFEIVPFGTPRQFIVYFDFDRSNIRPSERATIDRAIRYAQRVKARSMQVIGHADRSGSVSYNQALSDRRARAVAAELRRAGISVVARGELEPAVQTPDGVRHPANRRAIIIVIEMGAEAKATGMGVRITAVRRFYRYPATPREREIKPRMLWPYDPSLRKLMRKFQRKLTRNAAGGAKRS